MDAATGVISLSDDSDSGLVFTPRTADAKATITGLPKTTGEFELTYEVLDFDVDPASATFTLTVSAPTLTLAGGVADGAGIELKKDGILSTDISLPRVSGGTSPTYALTAKQTLSSAGAPVTEAATAVATTAAAAPGGLTYTADTGSSAGKLSGTPTAVGTWELIYTLMDGSATDSISFTVSVVEDSNPALEPVRLAALNGQSSPYSTGEDVALGAPAFLLPAIADSGHGAVTESLTTTCEVLTVDCSANLTTQPDGNIVPTGLTFSASSGGTPASLTGAVTAVGDYQITYTLTDTAIGSGNAITYQAAETADSVEVVHTLDVVPPADGVAQKTNDIAAITNLPRSTSSVASTRAINLYDYFRPPSGLTFTAMSSNTKVLTLSETGGVLTLTATQAGGTSEVTVSASNAATSTDPSTSFEVTVVPNNAPELTTAQQAEIQKLSQSMTLGADVALDLDTYFSDADADAGYPETLTYELLDTNGAVRASVDYEQSSTTVLSAALSGTTLTLSPKVNTTADVTITVRATDPGGNPGTGTFVATVSNTAPTAIGSIAPITLAHGQSHSISDVAALFSDTDSGDSLTYTFSAADTAALTGVLTGTSLTLTAAADIAATSTTATLTASDGKATVDQPITVTISNAAPALSGTAQAPLALLVGGASASIDLSTLFSDADSTLSYTATSSAATVASLNTDANDVPVSGGTPTSSLEITAEAVGSATLTLSANDRATRSGVSNPSLTVAVTVTRVDRPMLADTAVADQTYTLGQTPAALTLPLAIANTGNGTLTYTLSGNFTPTGGGGGAITVDDEGDIVQGATDTGLDFTDVSGATAASIGGVPTAAGALALTWTLSDGDQNEVVCTGLSPLAPAGCDTDFDSFAITLNAAPTFGAATVADVSAAVNTAISSLDLPRATAGTAPLAYRLTGVVVSGAALGSTTLGSVAHQHPAGLTFALSSSGATEAATLVGTPAAAGVYSMTWTATDANSIGTSAAFQIIVSGSTPLFVGTVADQSLSAQLAIAAQTLPAAAGGTGDLTYSLTGAIASGSTGLLASNLPAGLVFDADTRVLSGTPTSAGAYDMTYTATDTASATATQTFELTVAANEAPVFSDAAKALVAANYNYLTGAAISALALPEAEGGEGALSYSLTATAGTAANLSNNLPAGLSFNSGSRTLSGTPTAADSYSLIYAADDTDSNTASSDTATIAFTAVVAADTAPTLTPSTAITASGNKDRVLTAIALPQAGAGNFGLSDSLEGGTYTPEGASPTTTTIGVESDGTILTDGTDDTTDSGLVFAGRTGAGAGAVATITGTPSVTGTFSLTYRVSDGDSNTSASTDEATVAVTLTVTDPALTLAGGVADGAGILLKREASTALTTAISLPRVSTPVGAVTYVLKATQTHDSSGAISTPSEATVATTAAAAPAGLTYTADSGSAAGKLAGTPSTAGIWTLTYEAMDAGGAGSGDDKTDSIGFTLSVVADSAPVMDATRKSALSAAPFTYPPGAIVGADADTAFALPVVTGGNGTVAETLTTTCALNGGSCAADAVTTLGANTVPKGLTFAVAAGDTPAGLTGTFGSPGIYTLTYSVTDTAIDNGAYQSADDTDEDRVLFTLMVQGAAAKIKDIDPISLARSTSDTPSATTIDLYQHFSPSSGLDFTLDSSNEKVLTVAETGGVLTLTATQAGGTSDVTVTASNAATSTDPSTSFRVTVTPTNAPVFSAGNLETLSKGLTIAVGVAVPLGDYFSDADSDALSYKLLDSSDAEQDSITYQQSSTDVLTATISGATLTLAGVAKTSADLPIEVRATDTGGNSATGSFAATVTNTAPMTVGASPAITLAHGQSDSISDVTALFSDAESDSLTYTYSSTDTASLTATGVDGNGVLTGTSLTLTAAADIAATSASATLTASDGKGQAEQTITVAISNDAPALSGTAQPPLALLIGGASASIDLSTLFSDADSTLSYTATSSAATVASLNTDANDVPVSSGTPTSSLEITAEAVGSATLTLSANDRVTRSGVSNPSLTVAVTVAADSRPTLATAVADQTYTLGQTPAALTLPLATANTGNGALTYTLSGSFTPTGGGGGAITVDDEGDIVQGATDTGLDFTDVSGATAASIDGVPTAAGALTLTWTLTDGDQNEDACTGLSPLAPAGCDTDFDSFAITLNAAPTFGAATVADVSAAVNTALSDLDLPRATAGTAPLVYRLTGVVVSGAALGSTTLGSVAHQHPAGLTFALASPGATEAATLVGTPAAAGVYSMTWTATDANSIGTSTTFQIIVSGSTPLFVGTVADQSLSAQLAIAAQTLPAAAGGTGTLTYSLTGAIASGSTGLLASGLPQGLAFDADTRVLSGEPTVAAAGAYDMTYSATDTATPPNVATLAFQLTVAANEAPVFSDAAKALVAANYNYLTGTAISALVLPEAEGGEGALSYSLTATAGTAANISNNLPAGLSFNSGSREPDWHADGGGQLQPDLCGGRHRQQHSLQRHGDHCVHGCGGGGHGADADAVDSRHRQRQQGPRTDGHRPAAGGCRQLRSERQSGGRHLHARRRQPDHHNHRGGV